MSVLRAVRVAPAPLFEVCGADACRQPRRTTRQAPSDRRTTSQSTSTPAGCNAAPLQTVLHAFPSHPGAEKHRVCARNVSDTPTCTCVRRLRSWQLAQSGAFGVGSACQSGRQLTPWHRCGSDSRDCRPKQTRERSDGPYVPSSTRGRVCSGARLASEEACPGLRCGLADGAGTRVGGTKAPQRSNASTLRGSPGGARAKQRGPHCHTRTRRPRNGFRPHHAARGSRWRARGRRVQGTSTSGCLRCQRNAVSVVRCARRRAEDCGAVRAVQAPAVTGTA